MSRGTSKYETAPELPDSLRLVEQLVAEAAPEPTTFPASQGDVLQAAWNAQRRYVRRRALILALRHIAVAFVLWGAGAFILWTCQMRLGLRGGNYSDRPVLTASTHAVPRAGRSKLVARGRRQPTRRTADRTGERWAAEASTRPRTSLVSLSTAREVSLQRGPDDLLANALRQPDAWALVEAYDRWQNWRRRLLLSPTVQ